jgi:hypothetical protein
MVDRSYNHPATIIDLYEQEVDIVVRLLLTAMPLYLRPANQLESALQAEQRLNMADYLRAAKGDCVSIPVWLSSKDRSCPGMVHAQRLPPEARRRSAGW